MACRLWFSLSATVVLSAVVLACDVADSAPELRVNGSQPVPGSAELRAVEIADAFIPCESRDWRVADETCWMGAEHLLGAGAELPMWQGWVERRFLSCGRNTATAILLPTGEAFVPSVDPQGIRDFLPAAAKSGLNSPMLAALQVEHAFGRSYCPGIFDLGGVVAQGLGAEPRFVETADGRALEYWAACRHPWSASLPWGSTGTRWVKTRVSPVRGLELVWERAPQALAASRPGDHVRRWRRVDGEVVVP